MTPPIISSRSAVLGKTSHCRVRRLADGCDCRRTGPAAVAGGGAAGVVEVGLGFHGERDAVALEIDLHDGDMDFLADLDDFRGVADEVIGELADVDEPVLMDADIHERAEGGDVGDDAGKLHADLKVGRFFDALLEREELELLARVAAGFGEFGEDVLERRQADIVADIFLQVDLLAGGVVGEQFLDLAADIGGHLLDERVALRVDGGRIERVRAAADAEEAGGLFEGFFAEARDFLELLAGLERAVFVAPGDDVFGERRVESGDVGEQLFRGGVEFHADGVDAGDRRCRRGWS